MRVVIALGGNALLQRGERPDASVQQHHVAAAARSLAPLCAEHEVVICHGNGPQIGQLAIESESDDALSTPFPLDVLVAQTQGMIGYWLIQELAAAGVTAPVTTVVTRVEVSAEDPGFTVPTKFIGPVYSERRAHALARRHGWSVAADGSHWRRVVASPRPKHLVEIDLVAHLVSAGSVVVAGGGGGIPVTVDANGRLSGIEAVVDKDLTAASMAIDLAADRLVILTDVDGVMSDYGTIRQRLVDHLSLEDVDRMDFPAGSMGPKIAAARHFAVATGRPAMIGSLTHAGEVLAGKVGTTIGPW